MGNQPGREQISEDLVVEIPLKTDKEKDKLLLGKTKTAILNFSKIKKKKFVYDINVDKKDLKDLKIELLYYTDTKTLVVEPTILDCPIHPEHVVFSYDDFNKWKSEGKLLLSVHYFALAFLSLDVEHFDKLLKELKF
jgi:uncharacterized protein YwbE